MKFEKLKTKRENWRRTRVFKGTEIAFMKEPITNIIDADEDGSWEGKSCRTTAAACQKKWRLTKMFSVWVICASSMELIRDSSLYVTSYLTIWLRWLPAEKKQDLPPPTFKQWTDSWTAFLKDLANRLTRSTPTFQLYVYWSLFTFYYFFTFMYHLQFLYIFLIVLN